MELTDTDKVRTEVDKVRTEVENQCTFDKVRTEVENQCALVYAFDITLILGLLDISVRSIVAL